MINEPVAVVTGAARGIGAATALTLAASGYQVVAIDSCHGDSGDKIPGVNYPLATHSDLLEVTRAGEGRIHPIVCDVQKPHSLHQAIDGASKEFGRIDVAVAAAAIISGGKPMWETPIEEFRALIDIDLVGVWNLAHSTVPHMVASTHPQSCRFIAIASAAGSHGLLHLSGYSAVKHAVIGLIKAIAADLAGTGVVACAISPGSTRTAMLAASAEIYELTGVTEFEKSTLLHRLVEPIEIAEVINFCCTPAGATFNGSALDLSGGFRT